MLNTEMAFGVMPDAQAAFAKLLAQAVSRDFNCRRGPCSLRAFIWLEERFLLTSATLALRGLQSDGAVLVARLPTMWIKRGVGELIHPPIMHG